MKGSLLVKTILVASILSGSGCGERPRASSEAQPSSARFDDGTVAGLDDRNEFRQVGRAMHRGPAAGEEKALADPAFAEAPHAPAKPQNPPGPE